MRTIQSEVDLEDLTGYDLVVAIDGANSRIRSQLAAVLQPTVETATAKFIWFGQESHMFEGLTFVHERGPDGVLAVHGYPISRDVRTFIVETDERSWQAAGLDEFDVNQPPGPSDPCCAPRPVDGSGGPRAHHGGDHGRVRAADARAGLGS